MTALSLAPGPQWAELCAADVSGCGSRCFRAVTACAVVLRVREMPLFRKSRTPWFGRTYAQRVEASTMGAGAAVSNSSVPDVRRKRGRPRDPEADGRILAAASSLILLRGFDNMTVDEVATNAGVGKATVYRRWSRKEDLAVAAMEQLYRDEMPTPDTGTLRGDLEAMCASVLAFASSPAGADYLRTSIKESLRDERIAMLYRAASKRAEQSSVAVFERAIARGEIRENLPIDVLVQLIGGIVAMRSIIEEDLPSLDELEQLVDVVVRGVSV